MKYKIITLKYDEKLEDFNTEELNKFLINKTNVETNEKFYVKNNMPHWTILIKYETELKEPTQKVKNDLNETQMIIFNELRGWRLEKSKEKGIPKYLIFTNSQLKDIVKNKPENKTEMKNIYGIGSKKITEYAEDVLAILNEFKDNKKVK